MEPEADQAIGSARHRSVGSDLAHAVPLTLVAGLGHWLIGSVDWYIVGALLLGSLPGISTGSYPPALASMLVLIGLRLVPTFHRT